MYWSGIVLFVVHVLHKMEKIGLVSYLFILCVGDIRFLKMHSLRESLLKYREEAFSWKMCKLKDRFRLLSFWLSNSLKSSQHKIWENVGLLIFFCLYEIIICTGFTLLTVGHCNIYFHRITALSLVDVPSVERL